MPLFLVSCNHKLNNFWKGYVSNVHDGDTFIINKQKIRLFGIDTPEMNNQYQNFKPTEGVERIYAEQATRFVSNFISDKYVIVKPMSIDRYKRKVAKVYYKEDLGILLIKRGLARVAYISLDKKNPFYTEDDSYYAKLLKWQHYAFTNKLGVWQHRNLFKTIFPKAS